MLRDLFENATIALETVLAYVGLAIVLIGAHKFVLHIASII